jgi:signal transduction histidine kinase
MQIKKKSFPNAITYLENIIAAVHESIVILDADLRVHEASASFYRTFQVSEDETEGKYIYELGNGQWDIPRLRELLEKVIPKDRVVNNFEVTHKFENIGHRTMLLNARQFDCDPDTGTSMILLAINDVTELNAAQQQLETTVEELQMRNDELDTFAHTVAHDLKNPVSSMIGFASLILSYHDRMEDTEVMENLRAIIASGEHIKSIINSLLLLSGVERSEEVEIEPLQMHPLVEQVKQSLSEMIRESNASLNLPDEWPIAKGYAPWVEALWMNYISNAIKYGGDPPVLELGWEPIDDGTMLHFWVQDNGAGLTEAEQEQIFQPFARLTNDGIEGHGLGLSVVQKITERLGGEVILDSIPGEGSRFGFTLPRA